MSIERIEIECTGQRYVAEAEIVLRGAGARRQTFRDETRAGVWRQIEEWLGKMGAPVDAPAAVPSPARRGPGRPPKNAATPAV